MASANSRDDSVELSVGSVVVFKMKNTGERFEGSVFYLSLQSQGCHFGIQNVTVWRTDGRCERVPEFYHFNLNDIIELQVNVVARQNVNTQESDNSNRNEGSSSKSIEGKMESLRLDPHSK